MELAEIFLHRGRIYGQQDARTRLCLKVLGWTKVASVAGRSSLGVDIPSGGNESGSLQEGGIDEGSVEAEAKNAGKPNPGDGKEGRDQD